MEDLHKQNHKCKTTYSVKDEKNNDINVDVYNYDLPNEYMPIVIKVLEELTFNAVIECRFNDASYYYWLLTKEHLQIASGR